MIKYILFDADGMVIHHKRYFSERLADEQNIDSEEIKYFFSTEWEELITGKSDLVETIQPYLSKWGWNKSTHEFLDYWFSEASQDLELFELIKHIRSNKIHCSLVTNQEQYRLSYLIKRFGLRSVFDEIFASCEIGFKKPDSRIYNHIWYSLDCPTKNQVLFWDDKPQNVRAANRFGFLSEIYKNRSQFSRLLKQKYLIEL